MRALLKITHKIPCLCLRMQYNTCRKSNLRNDLHHATISIVFNQKRNNKIKSKLFIQVFLWTIYKQLTFRCVILFRFILFSDILNKHFGDYANQIQKYLLCTQIWARNSVSNSVANRCRSSLDGDARHDGVTCWQTMLNPKPEAINSKYDFFLRNK